METISRTKKSTSSLCVAFTKHVILILCACASLYVQAQESLNYRRNSLATMLVYHPEDEFGPEIYKAFDSMPLPDKYDDHNIADMRVINNNTVWGVQRNDSGYYKATYGHQLSAAELKANAQYTERLLNEHEVGKWMVAKWFGLEGDNIDEATFNTELIQTRGQYNANDLDVALALQTTRGLATLSDAGEELIDQTFILVNDITYVTAEEEARAAKIAMGVLGGLLDAFTGGSAGRDIAKAGAAIADSFTGFKVKTHSYLYQLVWNDSIAAIFYQMHYTGTPNPEKVRAFLNDKSTYRVRYVAHEYEFDKKSVLKGQYTRTELVRTICARSMDKNIVALGKQYEDFKVKTPVYQVLADERGRITGYAAKIGMKEGISDGTKFQVVQRYIDPKTNRSGYKYIASVKAIKGKIWDNRYNAVLEQADGATLPYTTFQKISGGEILPGMLLIEGKYTKITE